MPTTRSELMEKIRLDEDTFLELKEVRFSGDKPGAPGRDALADELAAFANGHGGVLVLGVDDASREVLGIPLGKLDAVEALVRETCHHRDYSVYGSKVRIRLFEDRLELYSPGMLTNTMTVESLAHRQSVRNEVITSLLARCPTPDDEEVTAHRTHVMDKRGEGVPVILSRSQELSNKRPTYRLIDNDELMLTIHAAS